MTIERRTFTLEDQLAFARLSGDWNPLHVDPVAARRTLMGSPVVHGVHLVVWALDQWLATRHGGSITRLEVKFPKPVYLDEEIELDITPVDAGARVIGRSSQGQVLNMSCELGPSVAVTEPVRRTPPASGVPDLVERDAIHHSHGVVELELDEQAARTLAPHATEKLGLGQVAELLATTRIVGMHCPGMHSLFGGLQLEAHTSTTRQIRYRVESHRLAYSMVDVRFEGPSLAGTLKTFIRPSRPRLSMSDVREAVAAGKYARQRALVVGGSRGIGEVFAKAIAAGGGDVCLTYNLGADDAAAVVDEIRSVGGMACAIQLDILAPDVAERLVAGWPQAAPPTHLYYLATPTLFSIRKGTPWEVEELERLLRYYVVAFRATVEAVIGMGAESLRVWTPSTTMLDRPMGGAAYCVAKAAMEELCRHLPAHFPGLSVTCPRLGRVDTDQTTGLIVLPAAPALPVVIEALDSLEQTG